MMLRTNRRDRPLLIGYLLSQLIEAAQKLWPEFEPVIEREPLRSYPLAIERRAVDHPVPFLPRWRRRLSHDEDDDAEDGGI